MAHGVAAPAWIDRIAARPVGELLDECLAPVGVPSVYFLHPDGTAVLRSADGTLRPMDPAEAPQLAAVARQALSTGSPAELILPDRSLVGLPISVEARVVAAFALELPEPPTETTRALIRAVALALGQFAARRRVDESHDRVIVLEKAARADAEAAQRRLAFLYQATGAILSAPLDPQARLATLAQLSVPDLADWCLIDLRRDERTLERMAVAHWNPAGSEIAARLRGPVSFSPDDDDCPIARVLRTGSSVRVEGSDLRVCTEALREIAPRSALILPLRASDRIIGTIAFIFAESNRIYDESDLALASDLAQRAALAVDNARLLQEAERAVRARDETLAIVSHDLRNPLSAIIANAGFLEKKLPAGEEGERIGKRAQAIKRSAERMNHLIRDLLDLARIESKRFQLERAPLRLGSLVAEAIEMFQPLAGNKSIALEADLDGADRLVSCDRERVLQVLSNLLGNALKFTAEGGAIRIAANCNEEGEVRIGVSDTGSGIAPDHLPRIFDRYWQGRAGGRVGSGLGLYIARGIVEAHGGRIWAESEIDRGSAFWFTLPAA